MIEKLSSEKITEMLEMKVENRRWRDNIDRPFTDFTAVNEISYTNWHCGTLNYCKFSGIAFKNVDFSRAELRYADFQDCIFENCRFERSEVQFANFSSAKFTDCIMEASLQYANFAQCTMVSCMFGNADVAFANLGECTFENCEALSIEHLNLANLPTSLIGLNFDREQYCDL